MIHIQQSIATKPATTKPATTKLSTKQIMPLPQQAAFDCAEMLAGTGFSGRNLLDRGLAFVGLWSDCEHSLLVGNLSAGSLSIGNLSVDGLFAGSFSIDSSAYINRLEPTQYRSGERRRLAAIPL